MAVPGRALAALRLQFVPTGKAPLGAGVASLDLVQEAGDGPMGGQRFSVKLRPDRRGLVIDDDRSFDGAVWTRRGGCCC